MGKEIVIANFENFVGSLCLCGPNRLFWTQKGDKKKVLLEKMSDLLFDPKYISPQVKKDLKEGFIVRPLAASDYDKGTCLYLDGSRISGMSGNVDFCWKYAKIRLFEYRKLIF